MGWKLLPGHVKDDRTEWVEIEAPIQGFLKNLKVGTFDLGNFGANFKDDSDDSHAAHYSIPNPWASAYLFHNVLNQSHELLDQSHEGLNQGKHHLAKELSELVLNLLNDYFYLHEVDCIPLFLPKELEQDTSIEESQNDQLGDPFNIFGELAPEFIKYRLGNDYVIYI